MICCRRLLECNFVLHENEFYNNIWSKKTTTYLSKNCFSAKYKNIIHLILWNQLDPRLFSNFLFLKKHSLWGKQWDFIKKKNCIYFANFYWVLWRLFSIAIFSSYIKSTLGVRQKFRRSAIRVPNWYTPLSKKLF